MNTEEYLKRMHHLDKIFKLHDDAEYNERQLIQFAERYHEAKLKLLNIADVSICLARAKKYAKHQHYLGTQNKDLVEFEDWCESHREADTRKNNCNIADVSNSISGEYGDNFKAGDLAKKYSMAVGEVGCKHCGATLHGTFGVNICICCDKTLI